VKIRPISRDEAQDWVARVHRHLGPPPGDLFRVALEEPSRGQVGVGIAGRPVARALDDGRTVEILRVAVLDGVPNACSTIYGSLRRAAVALGWERVITYTLPEEGGASLRAAGFVFGGLTDGGEWSCPSRPRLPGLRTDRKARWLWPAELWAEERRRWVGTVQDGGGL
jgi:hypothetical protein